MRGGRYFWKFQLAWIIIALTSHSVSAANLAIDDIVGRWCGTESNYTLTRTQLAVVRLDGKALKSGPVLQIAKVEGTSDQIHVFWLPERPGNSTLFELAADKRRLVQMPQTEGDKGPRREFRRC
jgi:hypothetical protein